MQTLHAVEGFLTKLLEGVVTVFFFIILVVTILLVLLRYGFNSSLIGGNEAIEYLFIYTTAIGAAISVGHREHIKITYFVEKLPARLQKVVDAIGLLLIAFLNGILIWLSLPWIRKVGDFESPVLRIPNQFIQISVPIGCGLVILYCLYHIWLVFSDDNPKTSFDEV